MRVETGAVSVRAVFVRAGTGAVSVRAVSVRERVLAHPPARYSRQMNMLSGIVHAATNCTQKSQGGRHGEQHGAREPAIAGSVCAAGKG